MNQSINQSINDRPCQQVVRLLASAGADLLSRGDEAKRNVFMAAHDHGHDWLCEVSTD